MENMITLTIDGIEVQAPQGSTVLEAAKLAGIRIPTLCFLKDINEIGACRVCVVEVEGSDSMEIGKEYTLVLRPEAASLADGGGLPCEVVLSCFMGSYQNYHVKIGSTLVKLEEHNPKNRHIYAVGDRCGLVFDPASIHVL